MDWINRIKYIHKFNLPIFMLFSRKKYKISRDKKEKLIKELKELSEKKLPEIRDRMEESRKTDYDEDSAILSQISAEKDSVEKRINEISEILDNYEIIKDKTYCEPGKIDTGSTVKLKDGVKIFEVKIVSSVEADPTQNYISDDSPLGKKLLRAKVGNTVVVKVRGNRNRYTILDVC